MIYGNLHLQSKPLGKGNIQRLYFVLIAYIGILELSGKLSE